MDSFSNSRRDFLKQVVRLGREKNVITHSAEEKYSPLDFQENPFPGQLYWSPRRQKFFPICGVDEDGTPLDKIDDPRCFSICLEPPMHPTARFNFQAQHWELPINERNLSRRTIVGSRVVREYYQVFSPATPAVEMRKFLTEKLPQIGLGFISQFSWSYCKEHNPNSELSLFFNYFEDWIPDVATEFNLNEMPKRFLLKINPETIEKRLKIFESSEYALNNWPFSIFNMIPFARTQNYFTKGIVASISDYYFWAADSEIEEFCKQNELLFPKNIFSNPREIQGFSITYDHGLARILAVKRHQAWWYK